MVKAFARLPQAGCIFDWLSVCSQPMPSALAGLVPIGHTLLALPLLTRWSCQACTLALLTAIVKLIYILKHVSNSLCGCSRTRKVQLTLLRMIKMYRIDALIYMCTHVSDRFNTIFYIYCIYCQYARWRPGLYSLLSVVWHLQEPKPWVVAATTKQKTSSERWGWRLEELERWHEAIIWLLASIKESEMWCTSKTSLSGFVRLQSARAFRLDKGYLSSRSKSNCHFYANV